MRLLAAICTKTEASFSTTINTDIPSNMPAATQGLSLGSNGPFPFLVIVPMLRSFPFWEVLWKRRLCCVSRSDGWQKAWITVSGIHVDTFQQEYQQHEDSIPSDYKAGGEYDTTYLQYGNWDWRFCLT